MRNWNPAANGLLRLISSTVDGMRNEAQNNQPWQLNHGLPFERRRRDNQDHRLFRAGNGFIPSDLEFRKGRQIFRRGRRIENTRLHQVVRRVSRGEKGTLECHQPFARMEIIDTMNFIYEWEIRYGTKKKRDISTNNLKIVLVWDFREFERLSSASASW